MKLIEEPCATALSAGTEQGYISKAKTYSSTLRPQSKTGSLEQLSLVDARGRKKFRESESTAQGRKLEQISGQQTGRMGDGRKVQIPGAPSQSMLHGKAREEYLQSLEQRILSSPSASSIYFASTPHVVRHAIEHSAVLQEAEGHESSWANDLLDLCVARGIKPGPDPFLACVAFYMFARAGLAASLDYILPYVSQHQRDLPGGWAAHFATHALKVLTGQAQPEHFRRCSSEDRLSSVNEALRYLRRTGSR